MATASFKKHADDLEGLISVLSDKEKRQLYGSLKKLGLLAAERLEWRVSAGPKINRGTALNLRSHKCKSA